VQADQSAAMMQSSIVAVQLQLADHGRWAVNPGYMQRD
jgi:hypothetical protein